MKRNKAVIIVLYMGVVAFIWSKLSLPYAYDIYAAEGTNELTESGNDIKTITASEESIFEDGTDIINWNEEKLVGEVTDETGQVEKTWKRGMALTSLQVPQKFEIVMDPFEVDKKTQIYSNEYIIKNTGETIGILKLTGVVYGKIIDGVNIQADCDNIHDGNSKNVFIELIINGTDRIVLLPEGTDYEIELKPDESITLEFAGKMNERAEEWQSDDIDITVFYDWAAEQQAMESLGTVPEEGFDTESGEENIEQRNEASSKDETIVEEIEQSIEENLDKKQIEKNTNEAIENSDEKLREVEKGTDIIEKNLDEKQTEEDADVAGIDNQKEIQQEPEMGAEIKNE